MSTDNKTFTEIISSTFAKGYSIRRFEGGERTMIHRWPAKRMRGVKSVSNLVMENVTANNSLLKYLSRP